MIIRLSFSGQGFRKPLNLHILKMIFFLLYIVETFFGNAYTKF